MELKLNFLNNCKLFKIDVDSKHTQIVRRDNMMIQFPNLLTNIF